MDSYNKKKTYGAKKSYSDKPSYGAKKTYTDKPAYGEKKAYGEQKPYSDKPSFGAKKPYSSKPAYGAKPSYGAKKKGYGDSAYPKFSRPAPGRTTGRNPEKKREETVLSPDSENIVFGRNYVMEVLR